MMSIMLIALAFFSLRWIFAFINSKNSQPISEEKPLKMGKLTLYPNRLQYQDIRCNLNDITHIGWTMTVTNDVSYDTNLIIKIKNIQQEIRITNSTYMYKPKSIEVYKHIAQATFSNRLKFYIDQLETKGKFYYNNCDIYKNGTVIPQRKSKEISFHLSQANFFPFEMRFKQKGFLKSDFVISLLYDRDVILTIIDYILQRDTDTEQSTYKSQSQSSFVDTIVSVLAKMSIADGQVSPEEVAVIKKFLLKTLKIDQARLPELINTFNQAKISDKNFLYYAHQLQLQCNNDQNLLGAILDLLFDVAIADGHISAEEELLILQAEIIFNTKSRNYQEFRNRDKNHDNTDKDSQYYLHILGLSNNATKQEIKNAYKRLVRKYHPDKVHHLGTKYVKEAEEKMKQINEAYEFLTKGR